MINGYKRLYVSYKIGIKEKDILNFFRQDIHDKKKRNILLILLILLILSKILFFTD